jgi:hypothetical protein
VAGSQELRQEADRARVAALRAGIAQRILGVRVDEHSRSRRLELWHDAGVVRVRVCQHDRVHIRRPEPDPCEVGLQRVGEARHPGIDDRHLPFSSTA